MAATQQWIVRYKYYVSDSQQSSHVARLNSWTADASIPFNAEIIPSSTFSIGSEVKGYLAQFDDDTKVQLEALPEV